jgi:hypothetical protein
VILHVFITALLPFLRLLWLLFHIDLRMGGAAALPNPQSTELMEHLYKTAADEE